MIKINLLRTFSTSSSEVLLELDEQKRIQTDFIKRLGVVLLGPIALFAYESYRIPVIQQEKAVLDGQLVELTAFNQKKESLKIEIEKYEQDKKRLNRQTEFLQKIQQERLLSVNFIYDLMKQIPGNVWLTSIKIENEGIDIRGESDSEKEINEFSLRFLGLEYLRDPRVLDITVRPDTVDLGVVIRTFAMRVEFNQGVVK